MQLIKDTFLIKANPELNHTTKIVGHNGECVVIDAECNKFEHATQLAEIAYAPATVDSKYRYDVKLNKGDIVFIHYHQVQPKNAVSVNGEELYKCPYFQIWCKIENEKLIPLEEYIFVEPILEPESDLFCDKLKTKVYQENIKSTGIVFAVGNMATEAGIKPGDKVFVTSNADLEVDILGKKLWRMRIRNVVGLEREGILICLNNKVVVREIELPKKDSVFILDEDETKKERRGQVLLSKLDNVQIGDKLSYHNGSATSFEYKKQQFAYINQDNINYIE